MKRLTTISSWTVAIVQAIESYGCPADALLAAAGIDRRLLADPDARIRLENMRRLWKLALQETGDAAFGLHAAAHIRPTTFHALGFAMMVSSSMQDALERLQRFYRIVSNAIDIDLAQVGDTMAAALDPVDEMLRPPYAAFDMIVAAVVAFARMLTPDRLDPVRVELMQATPPDPGRYRDFFRAPVTFGAAHNCVYFPLDRMHTPLPAANAEIARANDQIMIEYLARFDKSQVAQQVRARLIELLPMGAPSIDALSRAMGMSSRSLNRHLARERITYREIVNDVRRYLATQFLQQRHLSIIEIAFRLGYSDASNFTRAFKRWFGLSPAAYRKDNAPG